MSHFAVLVVGEDVENQLQPFHEFECTGEADEFVVTVDKTDEAREAYQEHNSSEEPETFAEFVTGWYGTETVAPGETPDLENTHKYGWVELDSKGEVVKVIDRTNPNKQWDWYVIGGRWSGMLLTHDGTRVDQARKGDIDFRAMRNRRAREAAEEYDKVYTACGGLDWKAWEEVLKEVGENNIDKARQTYQSQQALVNIRKTKLFLFDYDQYLMPREMFIEQARQSTCVTFAVLKDGTWYERGSMGWWGVVSNETDQATWNQKFNELIDSLPDDTLLTVVDCHI